MKLNSPGGNLSLHLKQLLVMQQHQYQQPSLSQSQSQIQQYQNREGDLAPTLPLISQGLIKVDIQTYFQQYENLLAGFQPNIDGSTELTM